MKERLKGIFGHIRTQSKGVHWLKAEDRENAGKLASLQADRLNGSVANGNQVRD